MVALYNPPPWGELTVTRALLFSNLSRGFVPLDVKTSPSLLAMLSITAPRLTPEGLAGKLVSQDMRIMSCLIQTYCWPLAHLCHTASHPEKWSKGGCPWTLLLHHLEAQMMFLTQLYLLWF